MKDPTFDIDELVDGLLARAARVGMNKQELCRRAGISEITMRRWKSKSSSPTLAKIEALEKAIASAQKTIDRAESA